jgi:hypothetical protein
MLLRVGQFSPCSSLSAYLSLKTDKSIQGSKKFAVFISVTRHVLTQAAFKKFVQSHFDRIGVVTRIGFQHSFADQRVNFRFA